MSLNDWFWSRAKLIAELERERKVSDVYCRELVKACEAMEQVRDACQEWKQHGVELERRLEDAEAIAVANVADWKEKTRVAREHADHWKNKAQGFLGIFRDWMTLEETDDVIAEVES